MCLAQGLQRSDAGEARNRGPLVLSQSLYHWATALPCVSMLYVYILYKMLCIALRCSVNTCYFQKVSFFFRNPLLQEICACVRMSNNMKLEQRKTMPQPQIESASMPTILYCVTMIQAEIHQFMHKHNFR